MKWRAREWYPRDEHGELCWRRKFAFTPHRIQNCWIWLEWYDARSVEGRFGLLEERRIDSDRQPSLHDISIGSSI